MSIFKTDKIVKRVIFNLDADIAEQLESMKERARRCGKRLDADTVVNKAIEKFLKKAEKKIEEIEHERHAKGKHNPVVEMTETSENDAENDAQDF